MLPSTGRLVPLFGPCAAGLWSISGAVHALRRWMAATSAFLTIASPTSPLLNQCLALPSLEQWMERAHHRQFCFE